MKTFSLFFAIIFSVTFAAAQNTAEVTQNGNGHTSTNEQNGSGNAITVVQSAETNTNPAGYVSVIAQDGSENTADVEQGGSNQDYPQGSKGGAMIDVSQTGIRNSAIVDQNGSTGGLAKVTQNGVNQVAEVWNAYGKAQAIVYQDAQAKNEAYLYQNRGVAHGLIRQTAGGGNLALVNQYRADNAELIQEGSNNVAYVKQSQSSSNADIPTGNIYQYGSNNGVGTFVPGVMMGNNGGGQTAYIDGATVFIRQSATSGGLANIYQGGDAGGKLLDVFYNSAGIDQDLSENSTATITQLSDYNVANLTQEGSLNLSNILQKTGDYNTVNLTQDGGAEADIVQDGDHNTLMGLDTDPMAISLDGSTLDLDQMGTGNTLHLQQANGAKATVYQNGSSNSTVVVQHD